jgi:DNA repair protein RadA/Sms
VPGQVILIAGEPGIGKSTLLLQVADSLQTTDYGLQKDKNKNKEKEKAVVSSPLAVVLYVSGEESAGQIKIRAQRLGIENKNIQLLEETDVDSIVNTIEMSKSQFQMTNGKNRDTDLDSSTLTTNKLLIVDSIQTMYTSDLTGLSGSVGQVRECAYRLVRLAKSTGIPVFIVGHVTKQGSVAGPSVLMHIVDTVLWFEGDSNTNLRILRAVKNRFGPTDEVGIFEMEDKGLISVDSPEKAFLSSDKRSKGGEVSGSIIASVLEGTRPILVEIQSLVVPNKSGFVKRIAQGIDPRKLELLIAVLQRRCGLPLYESDVFVNVAGGINIKNDPSCDLAIALSIASSYFDKTVSANTIAIGEIGLLGEIREVKMQGNRIKEAKRLGYTRVISRREFAMLQETIRKTVK